MRYGFYTPDLAMHDVPEDAILQVWRKEYNPRLDMIYWEFNLIEV